MTISKERFEQMALEVAKDVAEDGYGYIFQQDAIAFAQALIKLVEAESEVVGYTADDEYGIAEFVESHFVKLAGGQLPFPNSAEVKHLIALPLVEE